MNTQSPSNSESEQRIADLERTLTEIQESLSDIDFCCGFNHVIEEIRAKIEGVIEPE